MAIVTYPVGSNGLNRSKGGATFSANFNGSIIRSRKTGLNKKSSIQSLRRVHFNHLVKFWKNLSFDLQDEWRFVASLYPRLNSLGELYTLTGFQYFVSVNQYRLNQGLPIIDQGEIQPPFPSSVITIVFLDFEPSELSLRYAPFPVPAQFEYRFWATRITSEGLELKFPDDFRIIHTIYEGHPDFVNLTTQWESVYGLFPALIPNVHTKWSVTVALEIYANANNAFEFKNQLKGDVIQ